MPGTLEWLHAFWEMGMDRQIGMAVGPVPAATIREWSADMDALEAVDFRSAIRAMDGAYLAFAAKPESERTKPESRALSGSLFDALFG